MESLQYSKCENYLEFIRAPVPTVKHTTDVLIKVLFCGVTPADVKIIDGELPCKPDEPFIMGREISGLVTGVGTDVFSVTPGDQVVVQPNAYCQICNFCRLGVSHMCPHCRMTKALGVSLDGGWAEYIVVPETQVFKLDGDFPVELGVFVPTMANLIEAFETIGPISLEKKIFMYGVGTTGILCAALLHYHGCRNVTVCETNLNRHEILQRMDINYEVISPYIAHQRQEKDPEFTFDLILDCSTCSKALEQAFEIVHVGGKIVILNNKALDAKIKFSPYDFQTKELSLFGYSTSTFTFIKAIATIELLNHRYLEYNRLGVKVYPLRKYKEAIDHMRRRSVLKAVFRMPDDCTCRINH